MHFGEEHQRRRVVRCTTCQCRKCGGRTTPQSLPAPYERSKVTSDWLACFVHTKLGLLSPLERIRRDLGERGAPLAMGRHALKLDGSSPTCAITGATVDHPDPAHERAFIVRARSALRDRSSRSGASVADSGIAAPA